MYFLFAVPMAMLGDGFDKFARYLAGFIVASDDDPFIVFSRLSSSFTVICSVS
jgi:hypothetical protein